MGYVLVVSRCLLGLIFVVSAASKLRTASAFRAFIDGLRDMRLIPPSTVRPIAIFLAMAEASVPPLLAAPHTVTAGLSLALALLVLFTGAIIVVLRRGLVASCPCFGVSASPFGRRHVVRNLVLLLISVTGVVALTEVGSEPPSMMGTILAGVFAAVVAALVITFDEIVDLVVTLPRGAVR